MDIRDVIKAGNTAIESIDLVKDYGSGSNAVHALRGVNIAFEQGRFTAIMGPSGSGKSTLMHTLAGLDSATSGHIMFDGKDLTRMNDDQLTLLRRHQIGFIFQSFNLLPMFTAEQNIVMPLTLAGEKPDRQWLNLLVETLGLKERLNHRPNELSGGQQQRVAIARALITKPQLVFADRQPRLRVQRGSIELPQTLRERTRPDHHHGHPRCRRSLLRGPRHRVRRRADRGRRRPAKRRADERSADEGARIGHADHIPRPPRRLTHFAKPAFAKCT